MTRISAIATICILLASLAPSATANPTATAQPKTVPNAGLRSICHMRASNVADKVRAAGQQGQDTAALVAKAYRDTFAACMTPTPKKPPSPQPAAMPRR